MVKAVRPVLQLGSVIVKFFVSHVKSFVLTQGKQYEAWCWIAAALHISGYGILERFKFISIRKI